MASFQTIRPVEHVSRPAPYTKSGRRQYQSCDHCRRNRRACDAAALGVQLPLGANNYDQNAPKACSSCTRSKKQCTFNWLLSRPKSALPHSIKRKIDACATLADNTIRMAPTEPMKESAHVKLFGGGLEPIEIDPYATTLPDINDHIHVSSSPEVQLDHCQFSMDSQWEHQPLSLQHAYPSVIPTSTSEGYTTSLSHSALAHSNQPENLCPKRHEPWELSTFPYDYGTASSLSQHSSWSVHERLSECPNMEGDGYLMGDSFGRDDLGLPGAPGISSIQAASQQEPATSHHPGKNDDRSSSIFNSLQESISQSTNKSLISSSLLQIYNDSLENALSCWVTENNCPYRKLKPQGRDSIHPGLNKKAESRSDFSIYARVVRLDEAFAPFYSRSTTKSDTLKASKALYASMMAFASQWSYVGDMETSLDSGNGFPSASPTFTAMDGLAAPFELLLQQSLWHECQRSLLACDDLDSFKVIFARMIFSMTQQRLSFGEREKILESQIRNQGPNPGLCRAQFPRGSVGANATLLGSARLSSGDMGGLQTSSLAQINAVNHWDGPPTHLETALRCLASWRRRMVAQCSLRAHTTPAVQSAQMPHVVDLQSFDMLFWLGVMCDTTSSALTRRRLVIAEDDCELMMDTSKQAIPFYQTGFAGNSPTNVISDTIGKITMSKLWGAYLLSPQRLSGDQVQWPCSADEAYTILQEAIPVKVLLWRRVARLQTLNNASTTHDDIENSIAATLSVYQHWTMAYGQFMRGCMADHEKLPVKVQSWYVVLAGHWHLGSLMAADYIESIDKNSLSASLQRSLRRSSNLVMELKMANANAISDLARVSCASDRRTSPDSAAFHPGLSETALLTEPWTNVMIQALERACGTFLTWLSCRHNMEDEHLEWIYHRTNHSDLYSRASSCIYALRRLGRKSDAASLAAATLEMQLTLVTATNDCLYHQHA